MAKYEILQNPHPTLRKTAEPVRNFADSELLELIENMKTIMVENDGWGLAAPQINKSLAIFVLADEISPNGHTIFINPRIKSASEETELEEEGCLSFTGHYADISRPSRVSIEAQDETGKLFRAKGGGIAARAFLHETDHLNGILFIDHLHEL